MDRLNAEITEVVDNTTKADERIRCANSMLSMLDSHAAVFDDHRNINVPDALATYRSEREKLFDDRQAGLVTKRDLEKRLSELRREHDKLQMRESKERRQLDRERQKKHVEKAARRRVREKKREVRSVERARVRRERENFWPKYVYAVTISIDATPYTPLSSRRGSVSSDAGMQLPKEPLSPQSPAKGAGPSDAEETKCDLLLSYVTSSAFWAPTYDLQLSTTSNSATLTYEALLTNATSETWASARITLSTSQTTFSGLDDALPTLSPWRIKLAARNSHLGMPVGGVLASTAEEEHQTQWGVQRHQKEKQQKPRAHLFGVQRQGEAVQSAFQVQQGVQRAQKAQAEHVQNMLQSNRVLQRGERLEENTDGLRQQAAQFRASAARGQGGGLFGAFGGSAATAQPATSAGLFGSGGPAAPAQPATGPSAGPFGSTQVHRPEADNESDHDDTAESLATIMEALPELDFQDSAMEETGLTTMYDLPGLKTLAPRPRAMKQRIARIPLPNVAFSHTVVAKYKPVAYLKARLRNGSRLALLRGPAGLTLDGSFLGRTRLPRCSAGDAFFLSLGIDPDLKVTYPRPEVRRSTSGFLSKEDGAVYVRAITLVNTRSTGGDATVYVLDQVPVSEDEKLRVEVLAPRGMSASGGVATGVPSREGAENKDWGKAVASLKKGGEVAWEVSLKVGKGVRLGLEYEVAAPAGEKVLEC